MTIHERQAEQFFSADSTTAHRLTSFSLPVLVDPAMVEYMVGLHQLLYGGPNLDNLLKAARRYLHGPASVLLPLRTEPEWDPSFRAQVSNMPYTGEVVYRTTTNTLWRTDAR